MTATEKNEKSEEIQCATFLSLAGEAAIEVFETFQFSEAEANKLALKKFEERQAWVNAFFPVAKRNGDLRVCLDPRNLNKAIKREHNLRETK